MSAQTALANRATKGTLARCLLIAGLCLFVTSVMNAQTPDPSPLDAPQPGVRSPLVPFPRFEDWSFLRDPSLRVDPYDRLKFIPLNTLPLVENAASSSAGFDQFASNCVQNRVF